MKKRPVEHATPGRGWPVPAGVMAITAVVFIGALSGEFLTWDDDHNFLTNMAFRGLDSANLRLMFTTFHLGP